MDYPLKGIKVVEVSTWAAGPSCGMWMAEWGADVIRVEPIEGDPARMLIQSGNAPVTEFNWFWELVNRSKRIIALDLKKAQSRKVVHKLVEKADILIANLRPGTLKRAELDYERLSKINPRLIYGQITGFGPKGPGTEWPAFDSLAYWARAGIEARLGEPGTPSVQELGSMGDHTTGMFAFGGIMLALYNREKTGIGQRVDVSLLGSGIWVNGVDIQVVMTYNMEYPRESRKSMTNAFGNSYECKDGKWFHFEMLQSDKYWPAICRVLGRPDFETDDRFSSHGRRMKNSVELIAELDNIFITKTRDEWGPLFTEAQMAWGPAQTALEATKDPCVLANNYIIEYEHPIHGKVRGIGCPIQMSKSPYKTPTCAPEYSQHTEEILQELGYSWEDISRFKDEKVIP